MDRDPISVSRNSDICKTSEIHDNEKSGLKGAENENKRHFDFYGTSSVN